MLDFVGIAAPVSTVVSAVAVAAVAVVAAVIAVAVAVVVAVAVTVVVIVVVAVAAIVVGVAVVAFVVIAVAVTAVAVIVSDVVAIVNVHLFVVSIVIVFSDRAVTNAVPFTFSGASTVKFVVVCSITVWWFVQYFYFCHIHYVWGQTVPVEWALASTVAPSSSSLVLNFFR